MSPGDGRGRAMRWPLVVLALVTVVGLVAAGVASAGPKELGTTSAGACQLRATALFCLAAERRTGASGTDALVGVAETVAEAAPSCNWLLLP